ncbi:hypothetical protein J6590_102045 [Homalodisca vitripennis]|nr:hypothetical protein J6590_102045 [Homalodisca vitripennis]
MYIFLLVKESFLRRTECRLNRKLATDLVEKLPSASPRHHSDGDAIQAKAANPKPPRNCTTSSSTATQRAVYITLVYGGHHITSLPKARQASSRLRACRRYGAVIEKSYQLGSAPSVVTSPLVTSPTSHITCSIKRGLRVLSTE